MSYTPPSVWQDVSDLGGRFGGINRPTAGARHEQTLPKSNKAYQLYSLNTPNGIKVNILLEELKALGLVDYDAFKIDISKGDQFGSDFVAINPNSKIPALLDQTGKTPVTIFESGAILLYLAKKYNRFIPSTLAEEARVYSWLMWQMGSAPFLGGGFGHFYAYAPMAIEYAINRYAMETKRQLDVLDRHLASHEYMVGNYGISDMAIYPWYGVLVQGGLYVGTNDLYDYDAKVFLQVDTYTHVRRWADQIAMRPAVQRAKNVILTPIGA